MSFACTPSSHTRRQPAGHQTRPKYAEPPSRRICWWCNRPSNPTWRFRHHPWGRAMLRKSNRSQAQFTEIEGPSHWGVIAVSNWTWNWVSRPSYDLGDPIWNHHCKIGERQLGRSCTGGTCTSKESLCLNPLPRTTNTICTPMSYRENLVSGTNTPTHQGSRATTDNCVHLVHLARCNLSCTCDHTRTP